MTEQRTEHLWLALTDSGKEAALDEIVRLACLRSNSMRAQPTGQGLEEHGLHPERKHP